MGHYGSEHVGALLLDLLDQSNSVDWPQRDLMESDFLDALILSSGFVVRAPKVRLLLQSSRCKVWVDTSLAI